MNNAPNNEEQQQQNQVNNQQQQLGRKETKRSPAQVFEQLCVRLVLSSSQSLFLASAKTTSPDQNESHKRSQHQNWQFFERRECEYRFQRNSTTGTESIQEFTRQVQKLGEATNAHHDFAEQKVAKKYNFWTVFRTGKSDTHC